jgi:hypothetical protein
MQVGMFAPTEVAPSPLLKDTIGGIPLELGNLTPKSGLTIHSCSQPSLLAKTE